MSKEKNCVLKEQANNIPFYFTVVFWGEMHRRYFLDLLLASLLSPNNIPALTNLTDARFLISSPKEDWEKIQDEPIFLLMKKYIKPIWLELEKPDMSDPNFFEIKLIYMSKGHKLCSQRAFKDKAIGVFVTPDLILSDGSVASMQKLAYAGKKVVLCFAIRFEHYGCMQEFSQAGLLKQGEPLVIHPRQLVAMALKSLHSETVRYIWNTNYFAETPITILWPVDNKNRNYVVHSYSLAPLVVNYNTIHRHDTATFDGWTIDGDYIYKNFGYDSNIHLVTDSDEITLVSFTKEEEQHIPKKINPILGNKVLGNKVKESYISRLHYSKSIDPLKRRLFLKPIYFHADELDYRTKLTAIKANRHIKNALATNLKCLDRKIKFYNRMVWYYDLLRLFLTNPILLKRKSISVLKRRSVSAIYAMRKLRNHKFFYYVFRTIAYLFHGKYSTLYYKIKKTLFSKPESYKN